MTEKYTEEYIGRKNNMLEVIGITHSKRDGKKRFLCKCDCGIVKEVKPVYWANGKTKSCGCYAESLKIDHSPEMERLRRIYSGMRRRCCDPSSKSYVYYGLRGIRICGEWLNNFNKFAEWALANGYSNDLTIDRIDNDGNYEPGNCRWADMHTQRMNQRARYSGKLYYVGGKWLSINQVCEKYDADRRTVIQHIKKGEPIMTCVHAGWRKRNGKTYDRQKRLQGYIASEQQNQS